MTMDGELPPRPGEGKAGRERFPEGPIPLYVRGLTIPLTEGEALGVMAQLSGVLQTRGAGLYMPADGVERNA